MTKRLTTTAPNRETWIVGINSALPHAYSVYLGEEGDDLADKIDEAEAYLRRNEPSALPVMLMTPEQFGAWESERMAARSKLEPCTEAQFFDALGALPPVDHMNNGTIERFLLGEPLHADWYQQYARVGDRYATKLVHRSRPSTWITVDQVRDASVSEAV